MSRSRHKDTVIIAVRISTGPNTSRNRWVRTCKSCSPVQDEETGLTGPNWVRLLPLFDYVNHFGLTHCSSSLRMYTTELSNLCRKQISSTIQLPPAQFLLNHFFVSQSTNDMIHQYIEMPATLMPPVTSFRSLTPIHALTPDFHAQKWWNWFTTTSSKYHFNPTKKQQKTLVALPQSVTLAKTSSRPIKQQRFCMIHPWGDSWRGYTHLHTSNNNRRTKT